MKTPTYRVDEFPDDVMEVPDYDYDAFARLSPTVIDTNIEDPYRCPVSTPTVNRRASLKSRNFQPPFITYTSLNRSLQIPNNISAPKNSSKYKFMKANRPVAKAQKKNFDCYFVRKVDKSVHIDAQTHSTWLSSLCAQPVNEIFTKYKRKSEANKGSQVARNNNSTPGEKALMTAWSSNTSNRGTHSVASKYSKSVHTSTASRSSRTSLIDPNLRVYGYEPEMERMPTNVSFALMPSTPTSCYDADDTTVSSSRASPLFQKVFKNNIYQSSVDQTANTNVYTQYQRDKRFPEIRPRKSTSSPTRKRIVSDSKESPSVSTSYNKKHYELEESPMQIVCFGQTPRENSEQPTVPKATAAKECPYRLPKALSSSLPELQGAG